MYVQCHFVCFNVHAKCITNNEASSILIKKKKKIDERWLCRVVTSDLRRAASDFVTTANTLSVHSSTIVCLPLEDDVTTHTYTHINFYVLGCKVSVRFLSFTECFRVNIVRQFVSRCNNKRNRKSFYHNIFLF